MKFVNDFLYDKYHKRHTVLIYPFIISLLSFGIGFAFFPGSDAIGMSSLFQAMTLVGHYIPQIWGGLAIAVSILEIVFLNRNAVLCGRIAGLAGFMLWTFAGFCYFFTGGWLTLMALAIPNMIFWMWQYLTLGKAA